MRIVRLLFTITTTAAVAALGAGCGGGSSDGAKPEPTTSAAAAAPAGFVVERGAGWSVVRPHDWTPVDTGEDEPGQVYEGFESAPGVQGVPSQVGVGVTAKPETKDLVEAARVAREINKVRYQGYNVTREREVPIDGGEARLIDATYDAYVAEPLKVRIVEVLVQRRDGRQMSLLVRGPAPDFDRLGLDRVVASLRVA